MLRDDDFGTALVEVGDDGIAVEGFVGDEAVKGETVDERSNPDRIEAMTGQENEADEIAERVGQRQNFGRHAAFGTADGLALRPPFAPCPWRWTLTIVASTMAYSMSGASEQALYGAFFVKEFTRAANLCPSSVSLFDLKARFFVPTRTSLAPSRAEAVKVGRRTNLATGSACYQATP